MSFSLIASRDIESHDQLSLRLCFKACPYRLQVLHTTMAQYYILLFNGSERPYKTYVQIKVGEF